MGCWLPPVLYGSCFLPLALQAARQAYVEELRAGRASAPDEQLCATPFGVDVVGITEFVALTGALVGGAHTQCWAGCNALELPPGWWTVLGRQAAGGRVCTCCCTTHRLSAAMTALPVAANRPKLQAERMHALSSHAGRRERSAAQAGAGAPERAAAHHQHAAEVRHGALPGLPAGAASD